MGSSKRWRRGADRAFEEGADHAGGAKQIWTGRSDIPEWAFATVDQFYPNPRALKPFARRLMARNALQVLGADGKPSSMVVCWTPEGAGEGGTGQSLRIAQTHGIPVFDMGDDRVLARLSNWVDSLKVTEERDHPVP